MLKNLLCTANIQQKKRKNRRTSAEFSQLNYNWLTTNLLWHPTITTGKRVIGKTDSRVQIPSTPLKIALWAMILPRMFKVSSSAKKSLIVALKPQNKRIEWRKCEYRYTLVGHSTRMAQHLYIYAWTTHLHRAISLFREYAWNATSGIRHERRS